MHNLPAGITVLDAVDIYRDDRNRFKSCLTKFGAQNNLQSNELQAALRSASEEYEDYEDY